MPYHQIIITVPSPFKEYLIDLLMHFHSLGVIEDAERITAYFPGEADLGPVMRELGIINALVARTTALGSLQIETGEVPDQDWNESWKRSFRPIEVGERFLILPPWEHSTGDRVPIIIDPGMAFGTGHHETTRSCLMLMERYADRIIQDRFLDLGTGTGLLAIAALKLGFLSVTAIDTDPLAITAARENARLNDAASVVLTLGGLSLVTGPFDMIAANLISETLIRLSGDISSRLRTGGYAVLSGILGGQEEEVIAAAAAAGLCLVERYRDGKWISLVVVR